MAKKKGADQLRGYREADLVFVFAYAKSRFSHDAAHVIVHESSVLHLIYCCLKLHKRNVHACMLLV